MAGQLLLTIKHSSVPSNAAIFYAKWTCRVVALYIHDGKLIAHLVFYIFYVFKTKLLVWTMGGDIALKYKSRSSP